MMADGDPLDSDRQPPALQTESSKYERARLLIRRLAVTEAELASLLGEVDSVLDPATATPILLHQAQREVAIAEERYNRLVAHMPAIIFEITPNGDLLFVNDALTALTGYLPQDLQIDRWWEPLVPGDLSARAARMMEQMQAGDIMGYELTLAAKNGSLVVFELTSANHYGPDGTLERIIAIAIDITERKKAEAEREAALQAVSEREAALRASQEQLQFLARRLVERLEDERRAIARELHDETAQSLTALQLGLGAIRRHADQPTVVASKVHELDQLTEEVMVGLHRLALNLRPASLDRLGLMPALRQYVDSFQKQSNVSVDLIDRGIENYRFSSVAETAIYRSIQEALTNVARHAGAGRAAVILQRRDGHISAIVEDDGAGFDVTEALCRGRLGLLGMRERAEMLGGSLTIESQPGRGATVFIEIPA
jgi:PAS domain S-box-containing protein